jgi:hypothetical protein
VDIEIPDQKQSLAVSSYIVLGDTILNVYVSHSQDYLDTSKRVIIKNAKVQLLKNDQLFATIPYSTKQFYKLKLPKTKVIDQARYQLKISAAGYPEIHALQNMPAPVQIISTKHERFAAVDGEGRKVDLITLEFQDPDYTQNYYAVRAIFSSTPAEKNYVQLFGKDEFSETFENEVVLKDEAFNGKKYIWKIAADLPPASGKLTIQLHSISRDKYLYLKSTNLYESGEDNPFAEPVLLHSNIIGGFGIFSTEARSYFTLNI